MAKLKKYIIWFASVDPCVIEQQARTSKGALEKAFCTWRHEHARGYVLYVAEKGRAPCNQVNDAWNNRQDQLGK